MVFILGKPGLTSSQLLNDRSSSTSVSLIMSRAYSRPMHIRAPPPKGMNLKKKMSLVGAEVV